MLVCADVTWPLRMPLVCLVDYHLKERVVCAANNVLSFAPAAARHQCLRSAWH